jgi:putative spermidine/putrescine transport system ATP-binding protein
MTGAAFHPPNKDPPSMPALKLQVKDAKKSYGSVTALAHVSLDIAEGEFLTLLGPSGSGKTTLLMAVAGLLRLDAGEIWIDGRLSNNLPTHLRNLGMVFQNYALFPHLTIFENIAFPLRMRGIAAGTLDREVRRALDLIRLPHIADRYPHQLSGGQQQRVALARCLVYGPPVVLMDEPMGALDKKLREELQLEIRALHREVGTTIMYVTHDQEEALVMSDRICLMNSGRVEQIGPPKDLYFAPTTLFAANFVGESNVWQGRLARLNGSTAEMQLDDGGQLRVRHNPNLNEGQRLAAMVRPEHVRVLSAGEEAANTITGKLREVILAGQLTRLFVETENGRRVVASLLSAVEIAARPIGGEIRLGWSQADTVTLPAQRS